MVKVPRSVGEPTVLARHYIRELVTEDFVHPKTAETYTRSMFYVKSRPVIIFPVTSKKEVIFIRQYRHAAKEILAEIPGGNPKGEQTEIETLKSEFREETGYAPGRIIQLCPAMWWEPDSLRAQYSSYLATDCVKIGEPQPSKMEYIVEVGTVAIEKWLEMIWAGVVLDSKTIVLTMLALPHLGMEIRKTYPISCEDLDEMWGK